MNSTMKALKIQGGENGDKETQSKLIKRTVPV